MIDMDNTTLTLVKFALPMFSLFVLYLAINRQQ